MNRRCKICGEEKPLDRYHFRVVRGKYYPPTCRDCENKRLRELYAIDADVRRKSNERVAKWRNAHREEYNEYHRNYRRNA